MFATKSLFVAAALTGALAGGCATTNNQSAQPGSNSAMDKQSRSGKQGCNGNSGQDKASCQGQDRQRQPSGDKQACSGKASCSGQDKQS
jgi:hypothetical protein